MPISGVDIAITFSSKSRRCFLLARPKATKSHRFDDAGPAKFRQHSNRLTRLGHFQGVADDFDAIRRGISRRVRQHITA